MNKRDVPPEAWDQPDVVRLAERRWVLRSDFAYECKGRVIFIPAGFEYDLASVPRSVWWLISPQDLGEVGALLHDWLYRHGGKVLGATFTRAEADDLFRQAMAGDHVQAWKRQAAYRAVRLFGRGAWKD